MIEDLNETVVLGWCDVSAAGCRSVLGCEKDYMKFELGEKHLDMAGLDEQITSNKETVPVLSRIELGREKVSLVALSSQTSVGGCAHFVNGIFDKVLESKTKEVIVVAAVNIKVKNVQETDVFQISVNCNKVPNAPVLEDQILIKDCMLNTIIQFAKVEKIPLRCFITQGYKVNAKKPNSLDGSEQSIRNIQKILSSLYGIKFSEEKTAALEFEENEIGKETVNIMYL
ncbi:uncharacterized protein LOC135688539 [Rhopilema esculentum]|uniref:uncharacterized protein LOC135688539 n=1 Tax=Rhopilema esculentum TaxID=499914 RepID=UPI0031D31908